ncbi:hypothetical protein V8C86DRAFT_1704928 [Haematococcus lacustris]
MNPDDRWSDAASLETAGMLDAVSHCISTMPGKPRWAAAVKAIVILMMLQLTYCCNPHGHNSSAHTPTRIARCSKSLSQGTDFWTGRDSRRNPMWQPENQRLQPCPAAQHSTSQKTIQRPETRPTLSLPCITTLCPEPYAYIMHHKSSPKGNTLRTTLTGNTPTDCYVLPKGNTPRPTPKGNTRTDCCVRPKGNTLRLTLKENNLTDCYELPEYCLIRSNMYTSYLLRHRKHNMTEPEHSTEDTTAQPCQQHQVGNHVTCAGGKTTVRVRTGNTLAFGPDIATGRALVGTPYSAATAAGHMANLRRIDPKLESLGVGALSGYTSGELTQVLMTGHITDTKRLSHSTTMPSMLGCPKDPRAKAQQVSQWLARAGLGPDIEVTLGRSKSFKLGPQNASYECVMTPYLFHLPATMVPQLLAAHHSQPLILDIVEQHEVEPGRLRIVLMETPPSGPYVTTRARIQLHLQEGANPLGLANMTQGSTGHRSLEVQQTLHAGAAAITLASMGQHPTSAEHWAAYTAIARQLPLMHLLRSLSPVRVTQNTDSDIYTVYSQDSSLQDILTSQGSIQVVIEGVLAFTVSEANPPRAPGLGIPIRKQSGTSFSRADLLSLVHSLQTTHLHAQHPLHLLTRAQNKVCAEWTSTLLRATRPITLSSTRGATITPLAGEGAPRLELVLPDPLTMKVRDTQHTDSQSNKHRLRTHRTTKVRTLYLPHKATSGHAACTGTGTHTHNQTHTTHSGDYTNHHTINAGADPTTQLKTITTEPGSETGAMLAFCTEEGTPLTADNLATATTLLMLPYSRQDALNLVAAATQRGGVVTVGEDQVLLGIKSKWLSPTRAAGQHVFLHSIEKARPEVPRATALAINKALTGLDHVPDRDAFVFRAVLAMAGAKSMQEVPDAHIALDLQNRATTVLVAARTATPDQLDLLDAVRRARARAPVEETAPTTGPGASGSRTQVAIDEGWGGATDMVERLQPLPPASDPPPPTHTGRPPPARAARAGDRDRGRPPPTQTRQGAGRAPAPQSVPAQHTQPLGGRWGSGRTSRGSSTSSIGDGCMRRQSNGTIFHPPLSLILTDRLRLPTPPYHSLPHPTR